MYYEILQNIKERITLKIHPYDSDNFPWFAAYLKHGKTTEFESKVAPEFKTDNLRFAECFEQTVNTYNCIKLSNDVEAIIKQLQGLKLYLETAAAKPTSYTKMYTREDGEKSLWMVGRMKGVDFYFSERVLSIVSPAITDLEELLKTYPNKAILQKNSDAPKPINSISKKAIVSQASLALFYYYCHEKKCLPAFPSGKLEQAYKKVTEPYGLAWKPFQRHYNRFKNKNERVSIGAREALENALEMLVDYPEALALAQDEFVVAKLRNPLT